MSSELTNNKVASNAQDVRKSNVKKHGYQPVKSHIHLIAFISLVLPGIVKYFGTSLQESMISYKKWNLVPHLMLLALENTTMWIIQQFIFARLPNTFWVRSTLSVFMMVTAIVNFGMSILDMIFTHGLLMRFSAQIPLTYYFIEAPEPFHPSIPEEGQLFQGDFNAEFIKRCLEAYKIFHRKIIASALILMACMGLRIVYLIFSRVFKSCFHKKTKKATKPINAKLRLAIALPTICLFFYYIFAFNGSRLDEVVPCHWYFYRTYFNHQMPEKQYLESVSHIRSKFPLPAGQEWLDQRPVPVYPLVHAPKAFADAYNKKTPQALPEKSAEKLPNVVFLLWESFSPAPKYVTDEVLLNENKSMQGQPYRREYLPKLAALAESGHTFMGLRSNGIPTVNGWHAFVTGEISSHTSVNMITSQFNAADDFPTKFRQQGYRNLMVWPSAFNADKKQPYVYRGGKLNEDMPQHLADFPLWFDEIHQFYPTREEAEQMGIPDYPEKQTYWTNDRMSSMMFNHFFNKQLENQTQPLFAFYGNVDTHEDFSWFDDAKHYDEFIVGVGRSNRYDVYGMHDAYSTVLRYADAAFGRIVDNIKQNAPETIVVILGDHGTRQVPLYLDADKKINEGSDIYYDMECNFRTAGPDMQFTTSAVMSYFGTNEKLRQKFDAVKNMTTFEPTDHQDLVETVMALVSDLSNVKLPSSRLGVDILEQATKAVRGEETLKVPKVSVSHINMEYSDDRGLFRMAVGGKDGAYQVVKPVPACIAGKNSIKNEVEQEVFHDAREMIELFSVLSKNDRYYSYKFRDTECVTKGTCEFPEPNEGFTVNVIGKLFKAILKISIKVTIALYLVRTVYELVLGSLFLLKKVFKRQNVNINVQKAIVNALVANDSMVF
ncbi:Sulfatase [Hexamita inflata]|uniref:Sulfatase n=1 Tax=Hexamita inflata TaxID=28002 RepID=A0AA86UQD9_9EUKA|nr:Sulfatase [Hexamita inflata]